MLGLNRAMTIRNDKNGVTVEVSTRKVFGHLVVDSNCVRRFRTNQLDAIWMLIVNNQFWDFERATMRESNKNNTLTIVEGGRIDFILFQGVDWQNNLGCLTWKLSCFEMPCGCIGLISKL